MFLNQEPGSTVSCLAQGQVSFLSSCFLFWLPWLPQTQTWKKQQCSESAIALLHISSPFLYIYQLQKSTNLTEQMQLTQIPSRLRNHCHSSIYPVFFFFDMPGCITGLHPIASFLTLICLVPNKCMFGIIVICQRIVNCDCRGI